MAKYEIFVSEHEADKSYDAIETSLKKMTMLAHQAILFEKIKQKINEQEGEKLDKIAEILVNGSRSYIRPESDLDRGLEEPDDDMAGSEEE